MNRVTRVLAAIQQGDAQAAKQLLPLVYDELRRLAACRLGRESPGQTLDATALVHEAYIRLVDVPQAQPWQNRAHFFAAAAEAMRRILVENARRKQAARRGGDLQRVELGDACLIEAQRSQELVALDEALGKLAEEDPAKEELVKLRYFGGLSIDEAALVLGISRATANRYWAYARAWLYAEITGDGS
jgi:RNA polymerase sigma factor (TIGR02999 family)